MLNFACRAFVPGRPFCRRLINAICGLTKPYHHLHITSGIHQDLCMWHYFFKNFNGIAVFGQIVTLIGWSIGKLTICCGGKFYVVDGYWLETG